MAEPPPPQVLYPPTRVLPLQLRLIQSLLGGRAAAHAEPIMTVQRCSVQINLNGREEHEFPPGCLLHLPGSQTFPVLPILPSPLTAAEGAEKPHDPGKAVEASIPGLLSCSFLWSHCYTFYNHSTSNMWTLLKEVSSPYPFPPKTIIDFSPIF